MDIVFRADISPVPKARPRFSRGRGGRPHAFTPETTKRFEGGFAMLARAHKPEKKIEVPVFLSLTFVLPRPSRKERLPVGRYLAPGKPDLDNLEKAVMDALKDWWTDDSIVVAKYAIKTHAEEGERPHVWVCIREAPEEIADSTYSPRAPSFGIW